jgi:hypothetical protein
MIALMHPAYALDPARDGVRSPPRTLLPTAQTSRSLLDQPTSPAAEPDAKAADPQGEATCVQVDRIRDAQVLSDQVVRLRLRGGKRTDMILRNGCMGLAFHESFYYRPGPTGRLCAGFDWITARSGSRCQIEAFRDAPKDLDAQPDAKPK